MVSATAQFDKRRSRRYSGNAMSRSTNPSRRGRDDAITPLSGDAAQYYLCQAGRIFGPIELTAIATWIGENRVTPRDWVFVPSLCDWAPILEVPEMAGCFYNPSDKPIGPPPGMPVEAYLKYYRAQQEAAPEAEAPQRVEKRQWVRIPLHTTMTFREIRDGAAKPAERHQAYTVNISEGGLAFEWSAAIATKTAIEVRVDFYPTTLRADAARSEEHTSQLHSH